MTVDCFKDFCMEAHTDKGKRVKTLLQKNGTLYVRPNKIR